MEVAFSSKKVASPFEAGYILHLILTPDVGSSYAYSAATADVAALRTVPV